MEQKIHTVDDLIDCVNEYGILPFWDENYSAYAMSAVNFMKLWVLREKAVNSLKVAYGKYVNKKMTFVSLDVFPHLVALRRDGYDFDSLSDEGRAPRREIEIMSAVGENTPTPSYELGHKLQMKGYDGAVTSLQNKTYLCVTFKKSSTGSAMLNRPEDLFGYDFVRSKYDLSPEENAREILQKAKGVEYFDAKIKAKMLTTAI